MSKETSRAQNMPPRPPPNPPPDPVKKITWTSQSGKATSNAALIAFLRAGDCRNSGSNTTVCNVRSFFSLARLRTVFWSIPVTPMESASNCSIAQLPQVWQIAGSAASLPVTTNLFATTQRIARMDSLAVPLLNKLEAYVTL